MLSGIMIAGASSNSCSASLSVYRSKPALKPNISSAKKGSPTTALPSWAKRLSFPHHTGLSLEFTSPGTGMQINSNSCRLPWGWMRTMRLKGNRQVSRNSRRSEQNFSIQLPTGALWRLFSRLPLFPRDTWSLQSCSETADHRRLHGAEFPGRPACEGHYQRGGFHQSSFVLCVAHPGEPLGTALMAAARPFAGTALISPVLGWLQ